MQVLLLLLAASAVWAIGAFFFAPTRRRVRHDAKSQDYWVSQMGDDSWNRDTTRTYGSPPGGDGDAPGWS